MKKLVLSLAVLAVSSTAFAQATASGVSGLVTATSGNQLINVTSGMTVPAGAVVSATGNGSVTLSMPGCVATLGPGQSMAVNPAACQQFLAAGGGAGTGSGGAGTFFVLLGINAPGSHIYASNTKFRTGSCVEDANVLLTDDHACVRP